MQKSRVQMELSTNMLQRPLCLWLIGYCGALYKAQNAPLDRIIISWWILHQCQHVYHPTTSLFPWYQWIHRHHRSPWLIPLGQNPAHNMTGVNQGGHPDLGQRSKAPVDLTEGPSQCYNSAHLQKWPFLGAKPCCSRYPAMVMMV